MFHHLVSSSSFFSQLFQLNEKEKSFKYSLFHTHREREKKNACATQNSFEILLFCLFQRFFLFEWSKVFFDSHHFHSFIQGLISVVVVVIVSNIPDIFFVLFCFFLHMMQAMRIGGDGWDCCCYFFQKVGICKWMDGWIGCP